MSASATRSVRTYRVPTLYLYLYTSYINPIMIAYINLLYALYEEITASRKMMDDPIITGNYFQGKKKISGMVVIDDGNCRKR